MPGIERYLAARIVRPTLAVLAVLLVVALVYYANRFLAEAVAERLPMDRVLVMSALKLGMLMDTLLPAAMVLGIVVGLGRLQADHEIIAMAAAGVGRRRLLRAIAIPVLVLALLTALLSNVFRPWAYDLLYRLRAELVVEISLDKVQPGRFEALGRSWMVFARRRAGDTLEDVMTHRQLADSALLLRARSMHEEYEPDGRRQLILSGDVHAYRLDSRGRQDVIGSFDRISLDYLRPPTPTREHRRRAEPLSALIASDDPYYLAELQWRLIAPLSVLVLALMAVAMSRIEPRHGQAARVLGASLFVVLWFSLLGVMMNWLERDQLPDWPGMFWLPLLLTAALALRFRRQQRQPGPPL